MFFQNIDMQMRRIFFLKAIVHVQCLIYPCRIFITQFPDERYIFIHYLQILIHCQYRKDITHSLIVIINHYKSIFSIYIGITIHVQCVLPVCHIISGPFTCLGNADFS